MQSLLLCHRWLNSTIKRQVPRAHAWRNPAVLAALWHLAGFQAARVAESYIFHYAIGDEDLGGHGGAGEEWEERELHFAG
ncbi:hypothetical protein MCOR07_000429 [Pyricularia oryzae]|uniref:Uncharacterized protein n=2 Tax=Pyricularia TaxID=48558 RepID=A0ABQ8NS60_PYRGI|nr:hypothetical protein MCOR01_002260 [Pyricularia oryzae]KAI6301372.1 hypothetical protein MCOR33_003049 [Pyricularia grisea]KAI6341499.1 hypothetical protein MCOR30_002076 [Pyricularia oryzae]KAI6409485.1 hypothetical protein MCOR23_000895 [Pyricularia oryzae]KAI6416641.1 hypothetical protein MCOR20_000858 [Pyricularia oryzae]